jgi:hypothetical protein
MQAVAKTFALFSILLLLFSCTNYPVTVSSDGHFNSLFHIDSGGVTGTDGTISIPLSDGRSLFLMGDFFLGEVVDNMHDSTPDIALGTVFITVGKDQQTLQNYYQGTPDVPESFLSPLGDNPSVQWIWPGHGFEHESIVHLFMQNYTSDTWAFQGSDYFRLSMPDFETLSQERFIPSLVKGVRWGQSVVKDSGYVYVYGGDYIDSLPQRKVGVHICRALISEANYLEDFEYYNGRSWDPNPEGSEEMKGTGISVSEQFTIFKLEETYVLLTHERGFKKRRIYSYISDHPEGPWRNEKMLFETQEYKSGPDRFTYNAMAHPQYIKDGELLISYNSSSTNVRDIYTDATIYRPMFLRVPLEMILNENSLSQ